MTDAQAIARGRYIARSPAATIATRPGYCPSGGKVPEKDWLTGDALGWRGDWGTTYPPNLRLYMQTMTEAQWVKAATISADASADAMVRAARNVRTATCARSIASCASWARPATLRPRTCRRASSRKGPYVQFPAAPK